jgi:glycosyltransferase involved in cell wall biosynthesis
MRILLVTSMVPQAEGAGAIPELLHAQIAGLRAGNDLTLATTFGDLPGQAEAAHELRQSGLEVHFADRRRSASVARRWRVRLELATSWTVRGWPWRAVCTMAGLQPVVDRLTATRRFDVVAVEENPVAMLRLPPHLPSVLTEHEAFQAPAEDWRRARLTAKPSVALRATDRRRWDRFHPSAWQRYDLLQVFSRGDARSLAGRAPGLASRIRVNPFGLVLPEPASPGLQEPETLLFAGTFSHAPNRDAAIWLAREIMPALVARRPRARLRIVGAGPPPEVRELAGPNVEVVADVPSMQPYLEAAAVVLAPVRTGGGMRMKVLQALAAGKAVVTTGRGAEGFDALGDELPFIVADSAGEIAAGAAELLADSGRRRALGTAARAFAERHHSPAAWAARLEAVYQEAVAAHA